MTTHRLRQWLFCMACLVLAGSGPVFAQGAATSNASSLGEYVFSTPPGWQANQYSDGITLTSPASATGERCLIQMWPMRQAGANMQADANSIFQQVFQGYEPRFRTDRGGELRPSVVHGISGQGWEYLIVKRGIGHPGPYATLLGFVFVAKLGNWLGVVSGLSKDPLISSCMGELQGNAWPKFFYTLGFKSWTNTDQSAALRQRMIGTWTIATANVADQFTFAANGRYASGAASQQYTNINNSEVLTTTQGFFGNGAYTLRGNAITLMPDDKSRRAEAGFVRVEEESQDEGRTWTQRLYLMRTSSVDGKEYEVPLRKTR
jgi:hypothetical protein